MSDEQFDDVLNRIRRGESNASIERLYKLSPGYLSHCRQGVAGKRRQSQVTEALDYQNELLRNVTLTSLITDVTNNLVPSADRIKILERLDRNRWGITNKVEVTTNSDNKQQALDLVTEQIKAIKESQ